MPYFDLIVVAVIALSSLFAYFAASSASSLRFASWIVGLVLALRYMDPVASIFSTFDIPPAVRHVLAFALILFVVHVVGALFAWIRETRRHAVSGWDSSTVSLARCSGCCAERCWR